MSVTKRWYVLHVYSGFEGKVAEAIREKARKQGIEDQIEDILVSTSPLSNSLLFRPEVRKRSGRLEEPDCRE